MEKIKVRREDEAENIKEALQNIYDWITDYVDQEKYKDRSVIDYHRRFNELMEKYIKISGKTREQIFEILEEKNLINKDK